MQTIRAAVCHEFGQPLSIEEVQLRAPQPGEVEVSLDAVAICHSDISYAEGAWGGVLPAVYGHEASGRITALGDGVQGLGIGDVVVVTLIRSCGHCVNCGQGQPTICTTPYDGEHGTLTMPDGGPLFQAMACGAFAEKVVVGQQQVVKVSPEMPRDSAALLACGVITGIGAVVNAAQLRAGQDAVIIGAGGVGLNAIQGARIAGARKIIAVDMVPEKLDMAREFGATDAILAEGKPWKEAMKIMGKGADAVFVTVGVAAVYDQATRYLGWGGKLIAVGMPPTGTTASYAPDVFSYVGQGIKGSKMGDVVIARDIPWMVDLYEQGRLKLDELVSRHWTFEQINEAIADTKTGAAKRNVIMF
ncbi:Zn-dependent alcohol dehydrogenase [Mesobacterium pallidum]|uniref:Zn-dependent alcohol dehydrogenase n=1 Tax=Mesobacterium pallidum TaxID=2872037 RepID=UPI001EE1B09B|nr:Zn-dependent alcohol dehydrogenase [Mesobacterium pallidum]